MFRASKTVNNFVVMMLFHCDSDLTFICEFAGVCTYSNFEYVNTYNDLIMEML